MGFLRINKVVYEGTKYKYESQEFEKNIVLVEGDNGTGKSTFCNLIYFALGGEVSIFRRNSDNRHHEITSDTNNYVDLYISVSGINYLLRRYVNDNDITLRRYDRTENIIYSEDGDTITGRQIEYQLSDEDVKILPINRTKDNVTFSDWVMDALGISVVELFHGHSTFKINFSDLLRLIYHDQQPNPENIYKKPDTRSTYVSDSEMVRKAVFELLMGKAYSNFYDAIVEEKKLLKQKGLAKALVSEYALLAEKMRKDGELRNESFLQKDIQDKEKQIERLHNARQNFKQNRTGTHTVNREIDSYKSDLMECELKLSSMKEKRISRLDERYKLNVVLEETALEIKRIEKVIFSHNQLNLFTSDTCPYCLSNVDRDESHCVCGASIEEEQYERFFYTSKEYKEILKTKLKAIATVKIAYDDCSSEVEKLKSDIRNLENNSKLIRKNITSMLQQVDQIVDLESLNDIEDKILELREEIIDLSKLLEMETKLKKFQDDYDLISNESKDAELKRKGLGVKAQKDIKSKVTAFSKKYDTLMRKTLTDCRSAKINLDNYLPIIDDGLYKEMSSLVSIRLMYFITLMHLALSDKSIPFPNFLLIDTPETAGIELEQLINCINQLNQLDEFGLTYQVIITTGLGKYPEQFLENRVLFMPNKQKEHMLLQSNI